MKIDLRKIEKIDLRTVPVRAIVTTSKGFDFELIERTSWKESWKDLASNLLWYDKDDWNGNHNEAIKKFGANLPTKEEFEIAENHGFRGVLPNINYWFWSVSVHPDDADLAYFFHGGNGYFAYLPDGGFNSGSARCVSRL